MITKNYDTIYTAVTRDGTSFEEFKLQPQPSSRATRLVGDSTRFLLVSVSKKANDYKLRESLVQWIREGVPVDGVPYRFLGYTESQVKEGKLMFFREDNEWTVDRILSCFGDLPSVYLKDGYGKYSARLGLSFSSTVQSLDVPHGLALRIPDLTAPDGSLHSDGCGMIRDSFAAQVCSRHGLPPDTTVFQIRRGGIKGLLVRYPDEKFDNVCRPHVSRARREMPMIAYRQSMHKYDGGPTCLELNNCNFPPAPARLNVQLLALLLTLQIPIAVFERLVQDQLDLIGSITTNREIAFMYVKGELDAAADNDYAQSLYSMLLAQHDLSEPQVRQALLRFQRRQYESLRAKMSLRISDSCYLFGVVDEYGILGPNEVFINLPSRCGVLVRDVIVGRNPCYHPGDIRKLRAVDRPELRHHRNCIVFSAKAQHSVPDTIASGDLDGDLYFVAWDPSLIPACEAKPLSRASSTRNNALTNRDMSAMPGAAVQTFMQLKYSRLLGMMSNEWTKQADQTPQLANAPYPLGLVPLIESALDIMKTGEDFTRLDRQFKALQQQYSTRSLDNFQSPIQHLRDMIPQNDNERPVPLDGTKCDLDLILRKEDPQRWAQYTTEAPSVMQRYNQALSRAISADKDAGDFGSSSKFDNSSPGHADQVKQEFQDRYFGGGDRKVQNEERVRASAWYYYGYFNNKPSFAWLGERYLNEMKAWRTNGNRPPMFVGAASPPPTKKARPIVPSLGRMDSQTTLIDGYEPTEPADDQADSDSAMDVDSMPEVKPAQEPLCRRISRASCHGPIVTATPKRSQCAEEHARAPSPDPPPKVSVESHPKPRAPTQYTSACTSGQEHDWGIQANRHWRQYLCVACCVEVHEKKAGGYWVIDKVVINERRIASTSSALPDPDLTYEPLTRDALEALSTTLEGSAPSDTDTATMYESADESFSPTPPTTTRPGSHISLPRVSDLAGFQTLRRLPSHAGGDVSSPIGSLRRQTSSSTRRASAAAAASPKPSEVVAATTPQSRVYADTLTSSPAALRDDWLLASNNPKPGVPVATLDVPRCSTAAAHNWKIWASGTHRKYTCRGCAVVVTERKDGSPLRWVPVSVL